MNHNRLSILFSLVMFLIYTPLVLGGDSNGGANGGVVIGGDTVETIKLRNLQNLKLECAKFCSDNTICKKLGSKDGNIEDNENEVLNCISKGQKYKEHRTENKDTCKDLRDKYRDAKKEATLACGEVKSPMNMTAPKSKNKKSAKEEVKNKEEEERKKNFDIEDKGAEECYQKVSECAEDSADESSLVAPINIAGLDNLFAKCPTYSSDDYKERSRQVKDDMKDLKDKMEDEQKDILDKLAKKKKEVADIQKEIDDLQPKLDEELRKLDADQMKAVAESQKMEDEMAKAKAALEMKLVEISSAKIQINSEKSTKILEWADSLTKCAEAITKGNNQQAFNSSIIRAQGGVNSIGSQKKENTRLIQERCVQPDLEKRSAYQKIYLNRMKQADMDYQNTQSQLQRLNQSIETSKKNSEKIMQTLASQTGKVNESFMKQRKNLLLKMQIEMTNLTQLEQSSRQRQYRLQTDLNNSQQELAKLGVDPKGSTADYKKAINASQAYQEALREYRDGGKKQCENILSANDLEAAK